MEARRSLIIEITILSAENLSMKGKPVRKNTYVVVQAQSSTTKFYPSWNEKFSVELSMHEARFITLEVQCKTWLGVRSVGAAQVAVSDFFGGFVGSESCWLQFLSYRLWDRKGQRNGIINFSLRVKAPQSVASRSMQAAENGTVVENERNLRGFGMQVPMGENDSSGAVTGIPVFWDNHPTNIRRRI